MWPAGIRPMTPRAARSASLNAVPLLILGSARTWRRRSVVRHAPSLSAHTVPIRALSTVSAAHAGDGTRIGASFLLTRGWSASGGGSAAFVPAHRTGKADHEVLRRPADHVGLRSPPLHRARTASIVSASAGVLSS